MTRVDTVRAVLVENVHATLIGRACDAYGWDRGDLIEAFVACDANQAWLEHLFAEFQKTHRIPFEPSSARVCGRDFLDYVRRRVVEDREGAR